MARLTATVLLAHPETGEPVALMAGDEAPEWAGGMLGAHVLDSSEPDKGDEKGEESVEGPTAPAGNASLEEWTAYALEMGKTEADLEGLKRDEIRELF